MNDLEKLTEWLIDIQGFKQADWDKLPDIGLYMDQVQTYIERQINTFTRPDKEKLLTPAMINNYIKDDLIPRAESKKYSPSHVALLIMIATLKQVLSMQDLKALISDCRDETHVKQVYAHYLESQQQDLSAISAGVSQQLSEQKTDVPDREFLRLLSLDLSIEARNRILLSERILEYISQLDADSEKSKSTSKS